MSWAAIREAPIGTDSRMVQRLKLAWQVPAPWRLRVTRCLISSAPSSSPAAIEAMKTLYAPVTRTHDRIVVMDVRSAELTKYAANAMLATKISFMNELANLAERLGADLERVRIGIGTGPRNCFSSRRLRLRRSLRAMASSSSGPAAATAAPASLKTCRPWCALPSRPATCPSCSSPWKR